MRTKAQILSFLSVIKKNKKKHMTFHKKTMTRYFTKIQALERSLKKIEKDEETFKIIIKKTKEFFGEEPKKFENKIHLDFFCKFCLENKVKPSYLSKYLKYKGVNHKVAFYRKRAFKHLREQENKELWKDYCQHLQT